MLYEVITLDIPTDEELKAMTEKVIANNFNFRKASSEEFADRATNPVPLYPGEKYSPIKHIVFISKENRTYDEVFGQVEKANGEAVITSYSIHYTKLYEGEQFNACNELLSLVDAYRFNVLFFDKQICHRQHDIRLNWAQWCCG